MSSTQRSIKSVKVTVPQILERKAAGAKITVLTAYDYPTARLLDQQPGLDIILVGDSLGMEELGYDTTLPVTLDDMLHHTRAVARGTERALVVGDMPFMSYQVSEDEAVRNAGRFLQEAGANAVKLEGGRTVQGAISRIVDAGIPVMGHVGFTPQSENLIGRRVQGRSDDAADRIEDDALAVQEAGAFAVVLELVPISLAERITSKLRIPTIGIGSGPHCDGQVVVISDMLGLRAEGVPFRHVKQYANVAEIISGAVASYCSDVKNGKFPTDEQGFR